MPTHKYKNVVYERPTNISNAMCKEVIDQLGYDYTFSVNDVLKLLSAFSSKEIVVSCDVTTKIQIFAPSTENDLYERSGH